MSTPETKPGFLSAGITAFSPWGSRSTTPKPPPTTQNEEEDKSHASGMGTQRGGDHSVSRRPRLSLRKYPADCPPLNVRWFHAVDIPKRKPLAATIAPPDQPVPKPKKFIPFSESDSRSIEAAFQNQYDEEDAKEARKEASAQSPSTPANAESESLPTTKVPVNEDFLFDVEIETRELVPAYWLGPVYEVKRGSWFTQDGAPVDENLATQLEEGYLKIKPWRLVNTTEKRSASQTRARPVSLNVKPGDDYRKLLGERNSTSNPVTPKSSFDSLKGEAAKQASGDKQAGESSPDHSSFDDVNRTHRLFGSHMNSIVTYQDDSTAWLLTDDLLSRMGSTLYQRFAGGAHYAGYKYIRGYVDPAKKKEAKPAKEEKEKPAQQSSDSPLAYGEAAKSASEGGSDTEGETEAPESPAETRRKTLERQVSSLITSSKEDAAQQEEEIRKREEKEMREDYKDQNKGEQEREIEHLVLVTHGIGQRLGIRMESINFIHDVNTLRKTLKAVYANSSDLQALNSEVESESKNSRVQVLPICWRHLLDFPQQSLKHNRKEHDLGDIDFEDNEYPNLEDITVEGVPAVRNLLTDLALDILLYQSPAYKGHLSRIVLEECNRIFKLFKERNPTFNGKVSLVGHSLGSAIMFDILCQQRVGMSGKRRSSDAPLQFDFEVEDFYALGSPTGLFQMLKGRTIAARPSSATFVAPETPKSPLDDPFASSSQAQSERAFEITTSSPLCKQIFNIFHPTDPIGYRLEPLISPAMSSLKAQPLPYTKRGIFGAPAAQGFTGLSNKIGQGVTDFWTSVSSGIASGLLNRSLGITGTDASKMSSDLTHGQRSSRPLSIGPGSTPAVDEPAKAFINEERRRRLGEESIAPGVDGEHPPTLIDSEIETLYAGFQKRRKSQQEDDGRDAEKDLEWQELEERSRKLRKEEAKVRALNANGRVDYSIQEGAFDISLLASLASHLSYWADEDVSHFMISQLLARHRVFKGTRNKDTVSKS
ncbi:DDHD-domain-containing protein [Aaosphaeria arxii CBS 175.79]|uniref:DDHD-domain-containing protein n=1 Tax=Aaosphaeria arxii CBS 175.79 TaxID=1450172 RepID=A0A6A5XG85_9PLEO|nr:DDHD-domain-containing protein [Aaosphaeria arxii CBS 175.79]KAF2011943.1 DDHD-domain-containing protein [Aaosphaeria arxii CBS 175.79]